MVCTQQVAGLLEFLRRAEPAAVVTEYDRNGISAPLVLSARTLGIPTYTLVHGTIGERCNGFYPLLADTVFCWGKMDQDKFLAAGVAPERTVLGGCPRLTRELAFSPADARRRMGLDQNKPVVMQATVNYRQHRMRTGRVFLPGGVGAGRLSSRRPAPSGRDAGRICLRRGEVSRRSRSPPAATSAGRGPGGRRHCGRAFQRSGK